MTARSSPQSEPLLAVRLCALAIFLSAFLLFQVQPLISKMILPWFGGSPAVWTTCMLFFQILLLAGYAYAHWLAKQLPRVQLITHVIVLGLACIFLPISRAEFMKPTDSTEPVTKILLLLLFTIGLPYLVLSSSGPLIQSWFSRLAPTKSPFRLYALSNVGSLLALLSYPVAFEPLWSLKTQSLIWSVGFIAFVFMGLAIAWLQSKVSFAHENASLDPESNHATSIWKRAACWFMLPALASMILLATTNQLCQNVAVIPMLWIAPLSVYLISFILCFECEAIYMRRWWAIISIFTAVLLCKTLLANDLGNSQWYFEPEWIRKVSNHQLVQISLYLVWLFSVSMLCHGEAVKAKPQKQSLTSSTLARSRRRRRRNTGLLGLPLPVLLFCRAKLWLCCLLCTGKPASVL